MGYAVGTKGQIVISKEVRDRLGVKPGWTTLQRVVDDHLEIYFLPPPHSESLLGVLAPHTSVRLRTDEEWDAARERAWADAARDQEGTSQRAAGS